MTFEEWWDGYKKYCPIMTQKEMAEDAWKLAYQEGFDDGWESCQDKLEGEL